MVYLMTDCKMTEAYLLCSYRLAGGEDEEEEGPWRLYFKLYCFLDVESMPKEGVEFAFMFEQVNCKSISILYTHYNAFLVLIHLI